MELSDGFTIPFVNGFALQRAETRSRARRASTVNRRRRTNNFKRLHRHEATHCGILSATQDHDHAALAGRIDGTLAGMTLGRWHLTKRFSSVATW